MRQSIIYFNEVSMSDFYKKPHYNADDLDDLSNYERLDFGGESPIDISNSEKVRKAAAREQETSIIFELFGYIKLLIIAIIVALLVNNFIIVNAEVPTGSMNNTIMEGDRLIGFRFSYIFSSPKRGDIIIFKYPDDEKQNYVKRIIGVPYDTVVVKNGTVYVNNIPLDEPYLKEEMRGSFGPYILSENQYFVMGDNRNDSKDSRYWINTYVSKEQIIAKAIFKYYKEIKILK